jgi:hypothetical protein
MNVRVPSLHAAPVATGAPRQKPTYTFIADTEVVQETEEEPADVQRFFS